MAPKQSYACYLCKRIFNYPSALEAHSRVHTGAKPFKCLHCDKGFGHKSHLKRHENGVHNGERPHKCPYCDNEFAQKCSLRVHINTVHNREKKFPCKICGKAFTQSSSLIVHGNTIHNSEKNFICFCGKKYAQNDQLTRHVDNVHNGPYKCYKCGSLFIDQQTKKSHSPDCEGGPSRDFTLIENIV